MIRILQLFLDNVILYLMLLDILEQNCLTSCIYFLSPNDKFSASLIKDPLVIVIQMGKILPRERAVTMNLKITRMSLLMMMEIIPCYHLHLSETVEV